MNGVQKIDHSFKAMSTGFKFSLYLQESEAERAEIALSEAIKLVRRLEADLSEYTEEGSLARIHQARSSDVVQTSIYFRDLLSLALRLSLASNRAFDPFAKSPGKISKADYFFDPRLALFQKHNESLRLSFGAIGKGYALDQVAALLRADGFSSFVLSAGGSSVLRSGLSAFDVEPEIFWVVDKHTCNDEENQYSGLSLRVKAPAEQTGMAYSVSAEYERGAHILRTGKFKTTAASRLKTSLVAHPSAAISDALSTAFFVDCWQGLMHWNDPEITGPAAFLSLDDSGIPSWNARALSVFDLPKDWGLS